VIPIVTPAEMGEIDRQAPESTEVLIGRAGAAVARAAVSMLGGCYGRRVVVIAGKGNNGNDGREAARRLRRRGVQVLVVGPDGGDVSFRDVDLVVDAAFGTGFRGAYTPPVGPAGIPVLAVDIPSGVDGLTGAVGGTVLAAGRTVTFAALKPGLVFEPGRSLAGAVSVADIGLDTSSARCHLLEAADVSTWLPERDPAAHKWQSAVWVVAGSPGMAGAAALAAGGAQRAGAGYVRQSTPGAVPGAAPGMPVEVVQTELPPSGWAAAVLAQVDRFGALVVGNGLGTKGLGLSAEAATEVCQVVADVRRPVVVDGDGLTALVGRDGPLGPHVILTPHDGEFARLTGAAPGPDRIGATRDLARRLGCVVLLKGGPEVVAGPGGDAFVIGSGDTRLATAGTGDVLAGVIAALAATGLSPMRAAAGGAFLHGAAGALGWRRGLVAGDLLDHLPEVLDRLADRRG
jgi:hydroxyethylthiazole kinase-like uncharacterized protein yjeF